jgi:hypothetical protein
MWNQDMLTGGLIVGAILVIGYFAYSYWEKHYKKGGFHGQGYCACGCGTTCHCPPGCTCQVRGGCPMPPAQ